MFVAVMVVSLVRRRASPSRHAPAAVLARLRSLLVVACVARVPPAGRRRLPHRLPHARSATPSRCGWWPFTKNMSSRESILFVNDQLILNPLEVLAAVTLAAWLLQRLVDPTWRFLARAAVLARDGLHRRSSFFGFAARPGVGRRHPRRRLRGPAARSTCSLVYVLVTNLLDDTAGSTGGCCCCAMVAVSIQSIFSLVYYRGLPPRGAARCSRASPSTRRRST